MKKVILCLCCLVVSVSFISCGKKEVTSSVDFGTSSNLPNKNSQLVKAFFVREKEDESLVLVTVKRWINKDENPIEGAVRGLLLGPSEKEQKIGVKSEIPSGTRLIDIEENENDVFINISNQFLIGGGAASMQLRYIQFYKTVKLIEPVKNIYLRVDGKELSYISGDGLELTHPMKEIDDYIKNYDNKEGVQP